MKKRALALAILVLTLSGGCRERKTIFSDNFNRASSFDRNWIVDTVSNGGIEYRANEGVDGSGCVQITSATKTASAIKHKLTGLDPARLYRVRASLKCKEVSDGRGAVLYLDPEGLDQSWNASEFTYGTTEWKEVYMDFIPDAHGEATICCGLGFPWETYNGGIASGTVWWDNIQVEPTPEQAIYRREGEHVILLLDRDKVTVSDQAMDTWLTHLDQVYEAYRKLVGGVPYDGKKLMVLTTPGIEPGYWAVAGNPILWNNHVAVSTLLERTQEFDDWGFGILHEIGHVFSPGTVYGHGNWNWNDEIFANFRMSYALEKCGGTVSQRDVCYRGGDIINYYKIFYDETIGAGIAKNNGDALHYTFLRIKDRYGWEVYEKAFHTLYALKDSELPELQNDYAKFLYFLSHVSAAAGEDVVQKTYTPNELALIEESLKN